MLEKLIADPRTDLHRVYNAMVRVEAQLGRPVSRHEVAQELTRQGTTIHSLDGQVWHLEMLNHIWPSGFGPHGKYGRRCRLYTTAFRLTRPSNRLDLEKTVPPEVRRAVRDVATALRAAAEALSQLDELADGTG